jgi:hypothetical protein
MKKITIAVLFFVIFIVILFNVWSLITSYTVNKNVYVIRNVFTKQQCESIIQECENYGSQHSWTVYENNGQYTLDNVVMRVSNIWPMVEGAIYSKIIPEFIHNYKVSPNELELDKRELYIIKYYNKNKEYSLANNNDKIMGYHQDAAPFSFSIALNENFTEGGIHFLDSDLYVKSPIGSCTIFSGKNTHSNFKVEKGTRYVIYGSLIHR